MRYRQVHLDFHTSEAISGVGKKFDKKQFQDALRLGHVDSITLFAKCHHGWSYYPSKVNPMHPELDFDLLGAQLEAAKEINVATKIYVSAGLDEKTAREHPDWLVRKMDESLTWSPNFATPGYHKVCMNSPYLDELAAQVKEVCQRYDGQDVFEGIFMDITTIQPCYCHNCVKILRSEGKDPYDKKNVMELAERTYMKYARRIRETIDSVNPKLSLFHNGGHVYRGRNDIAFLNSHLELEALPTGGWGYDYFPQSARYFHRFDIEMLGMTGKFHKAWGEFGGFKHPNALRYEVSLNAALGAKSSIGDQLHPSGEMDMATYKLIGAAYSELEAKEPWLGGAEAVADIAVLSNEAIDNSDNEIVKGDNGAVRILQEGHYLFDMIDEDSDLDRYKVVVLPDCPRLSKKTLAKLKAFCKNGGKVLATGAAIFDNETNVAALSLGAKFVSEQNEYSVTYFRPTEENEYLDNTGYLFYNTTFCVEEDGGKTLFALERPYFERTAEHFCSHLHAPDSGEVIGAGMTEGEDGIYISAHVFNEYVNKGCLLPKYLVFTALDRLLGEGKTLTVSLPSQGKVTFAEQKPEGRYVCHLLYNIPSHDSHTNARYVETASIAARVSGGTVTNCYSEAIINNQNTVSNTYIGAASIGGILGSNSAKVTIQNSTNNGVITANGGSLANGVGRPGGILGNNGNAETTISNCLNTGSLSEPVNNLTGGMLGNRSVKGITITKSLNLSSNVNSAIYGGGQQVVKDTSDIKLNNYYVVKGLADKQLGSGGYTSSTAIAEGLSINKLDISELISVDVVDEGKKLEGWSYKAGFIPEPSGLVDIPWSTVASQYVFSDGGQGTVASPYVLNNKNFGGLIINAGTNKFAKTSFKLTEDITLNNTAKDGDASQWNPMNAPKSVVLNSVVISDWCTGTFDGDGHTISGIYMNNTGRFTGLYGHVSATGTVKNLAIVNSYFRSCSSEGYNSVGTIAARTQDGGTIENCYVDAIVTYDPANVAEADQKYCGVGGIVGAARATNTTTDGLTAGNIRNCVFAGTILNGYNGVGGILGFVENTSVTISNCLNMGSLYSTKSNCVGAIFGTRIGKVYMDNCANLSTTINNAANVAYEMHGSWSSVNVVVNNFVTVTGFKTANGYLDMNKVTVATAGTAANTTNYKNISEVSVSAFVDATNKVLPAWTYKAGYVPSPSTLFEMKLVDLITSETMGLKTVGDIHSIRISKENPGLRIETIVGNVELINTLKAAGATVEYVTYITAAKYVTGMDGDEAYLGTKVTELTTEALDAAGKKYITVEAEDYLRTQDKDGYTAFAGSVANINNLDMQYLAVGCIIVTFEGETYKFYAEWNVDEANSVSAVATLASKDWRGAEDVENGYVNKIVNTDGTTVYSPYTQVQYDCIKSLISGN